MAQMYWAICGPGRNSFYMLVLASVLLVFSIVCIIWAITYPKSKDPQDTNTIFIAFAVVSLFMAALFALSPLYVAKKAVQAENEGYTCYLDGQETDLSVKDMLEANYSMKFIESKQMVLAETGESKTVDEYFGKFGEKAPDKGEPNDVKGY